MIDETAQNRKTQTSKTGLGEAEKNLLNAVSLAVSEHMGLDLILFNHDLQILYSTPHASAILEVSDSVDKTMSAGTDEKIWDRWTTIFHNALRVDQKMEFRDVRYKKNQKQHHLDLTCIPLPDRNQETQSRGILLIQNTSGVSSFEGRQAHAERLIAIGKVAGRVAHELNNPLDGILRYINLSIRVLNEGQIEKTQEYLRQCRTGLQRMIQILGELLEFSRSTCLTCEKLPADRLLADAIKTLEHSLNGIQVMIDRRFKGAGPVVHTNSMFQVFCNLIKNAADAMQGSGSLTISIDQSDTAWILSFRDTGPGFDPASTEALFQPFYTTKAPGRGTGLGLAICKDILERLGGSISAVNAPEGGSIFTVTLPLRDNLNPPAGESSHE